MAQPYSEPCNQALIGAQPCPEEAGREISPIQRQLVLAACILASSMAFIDGSALTVALPALREEFGGSVALVQWVLNGYVLSLAALTLIGGSLADVYGKARMLGLGTLLFAATSAACALATNAPALITARFFQGAAAALVTPASLALIGAVYPKRLRNRAIGTWAAASALTTAAAPLLGGWLTETIGWQAIFWLNVPFGLLAALMLARFAPPDETEARTFDLPGAIVLTAALTALTYGLSLLAPEGGGDRLALGWQPLTWTGIGLAGLFIYWQIERASDHPMTPPALFSGQAFRQLNIATFFIYGALSIMFFLLPFDLIERREISPSGVGLAFLPFTLALGILSRVFGSLADRFGAQRLLIIGAVGAAIGYVWMALTPEASLLIGIYLPIGFIGIAFAVLVAPLTAEVLSSVSAQDEGLASGVNNTASRVAQMVGVAGAALLVPLSAGYQTGFWIAAVLSVLGALSLTYQKKATP